MALPLSEPIEHVAEFIVYAMPGFVALHLYRTVYPVKGLSEFLQVAWSLIYGVILASLVRAVDVRFLNFRLHSADEGLPRLSFVVVLIIAGLSWGFCLVGLNKLRTLLSNAFSSLKFLAPDVQSIWAKINEPLNTDWAIVYTDDGAIYIGWIKEFTYDPDASDNDFLLSMAKRVNEDLTIRYEIDGKGVYLNTRNLKRIELVRGT